MKKNTLLKIVNPILMTLAVNQFATGLQPKLYGAGSFKLMHKQMALVLSAALLAHLVLNFYWVKRAYGKPGSTQKKPLERQSEAA